MVTSAESFCHLRAPVVVWYSRYHQVNDWRCLTEYPPRLLGNAVNYHHLCGRTPAAGAQRCLLAVLCRPSRFQGFENPPNWTIFPAVPNAALRKLNLTMLKTVSPGLGASSPLVITSIWSAAPLYRSFWRGLAYCVNALYWIRPHDLLHSAHRPRRIILSTATFLGFSTVRSRFATCYLIIHSINFQKFVHWSAVPRTAMLGFLDRAMPLGFHAAFNAWLILLWPLLTLRSLACFSEYQMPVQILVARSGCHSHTSSLFIFIRHQIPTVLQGNLCSLHLPWPHYTLGTPAWPYRL